MAYVGTVGFVDVDGGFLATRKYAATHHEGPEGIVARMTADVRAAKLRPSEDITTQPEALEAQKGA